MQTLSQLRKQHYIEVGVLLRQALEANDYHVQNAAATLGIHRTAFTRMFDERFGMPPSQYRKTPK